MLALIQRVKRAEVRVDNKTISRIESGICLFLGVRTGDTEKDSEFLLQRIQVLKFFKDREQGKFVHNLKDYPDRNNLPQLLVVSQFTLYADLRNGTKPSFTRTMEPETANRLYEEFCAKLSALGYTVNTGKFGAYMDVELINDGPATFILSSDHLPHHETNKIRT
jgi:D-aminoacyl-tRNA deacylase